MYRELPQGSEALVLELFSAHLLWVHRGVKYVSCPNTQQGDDSENLLIHLVEILSTNLHLLNKCTFDSTNIIPSTVVYIIMSIRGLQIIDLRFGIEINQCLHNVNIKA